MCVIAGAVGAGVAGAATSSLVSSAMGGGGGGSQQAANAADPFASQRPQYQTMLSNLINNPSSVTSTPGYQFQMDQALKGVEGSAAAQGMLNSGNVLSALTTQAGNQASTQYYNQAELLAQLAGANIGSPGTAGQILQGQNVSNQQAASALGNQIGGAVTQGITGSNWYQNYTNPASGSFSGGDFSGAFVDPSTGYSGGGNQYGFTFQP